MRLISRWRHSSVFHHAKRVRGFRTGWWFLTWLVGMLRLRKRRLPDAPRVARSDAPTVSILLATKRPAFLRWSTANVSRLDYPQLELILALHGDGFDDHDVQAVLDAVLHTSRFVHVSAALTLGDALNEAAALATGELLTKMDDDDLYGAMHIWDLVLAHRRSGATLVGKGAETVYLSESNQTVRRSGLGSEKYAHTVTGSTMMMSRSDFDDLDGWAPIKSGVDTDMIDRVITSGGLVYRAGGKGYIQVRHLQEHTMQRNDRYFLDLLNVETAVPGWCPSLAGIDGALEVPPPFMEQTPAGTE